MYIDNIAVNDQSVGLEENELSNVSVYPNPSNGIVNIEVELDGSSTASINVLNNLGQIVFNETQSTDGKMRIDLSTLSTGVYTVKVDIDGKTTAQRISLVK